MDEVCEDFLALGLSSARLWPLVLRRIHWLYQRNWVGRKVGIHSLSSRLSVEQMQNYGIEDTTSIRSDGFLMEHGRDFFKGRRDSGWLCLLHVSPGYSSKRHLKMMKYEMETRPQDLVKIRQDPTQPDVCSEQKKWVLRNLTTRQYVRSDQLQESVFPAPDWRLLPKFREPILPRMKRLCNALSRQKRNVSKDKKHSMPEPDQPLTLANIFLVLTCSKPSLLLAGERTDSPKRYLNFEDGPWAGCAFDVIPLDDHLLSQQRQSGSKTQPNESWVNVSKEVVANVANLRFCVRRKQEMRTYGHELYFVSDGQTVMSAYWDDFWARVTRTRKLHQQWVKTCPPRPWIDESMYAET
jgi:hypothetical protein